MPCERLAFDAVDALALEQDDFVASIRALGQPRVSGQAGREALAVAEQILARIRTHAWDGSDDGPVGPLALPRRNVIPAPHFPLPGSPVSAVANDANSAVIDGW